MAKFSQREIEDIHEWEGGFTANPQDSGNWTGGEPEKGELKGTKFGIAASTHPELDIENLTFEDAIALYQKEYWDLMRLDGINDQKLADDIFDAGINIGPVTAVKILQAAAGTFPDGVLGPRSYALINADAVDVGNRFIELREARYKALAHDHPDDVQFLAGWLRRAESFRE